jgi:hypothetical protein
LPLLCLIGNEAPVVAGSSACLPKPINDGELAAQLDAALQGTANLPPIAEVQAEAMARARAQYTLSQNLVEAALEMERGISQRESDGD